jgi:cobalt-zinc-cadmium efflux system outer membrane protein
MQRNLIDHYRRTVLPLRERIVDLTLKNYNYMLMGAFDLLMAKQQEYESYQKYLEAVRDYWIIRADMQRSLGGRLPTHMQSKRILQPDTIETSTMNKQNMQKHKMN